MEIQQVSIPFRAGMSESIRVFEAESSPPSAAMVSLVANDVGSEVAAVYADLRPQPAMFGIPLLVITVKLTKPAERDGLVKINVAARSMGRLVDVTDRGHP